MYSLAMLGAALLRFIQCFGDRQGRAGASRIYDETDAFAQALPLSQHWERGQGVRAHCAPHRHWA